MKRELPFLSPVSILAAVLVLGGLGISLWESGGLAFSPGPVSAQTSPGIILQQYRSHAEFERNCFACHQPLSTDQASLCLQCHADISLQRESKTGTHGWVDASLACAGCHPEHRGRNFDPTAYAVDRFDHHQMKLPLSGAHAELQCAACHQAGNFTLAYQGCAGCHSEPEIHAGMYPPTCDKCHTDYSWKPARIEGRPFDHTQAPFSLAAHTRPGGEVQVRCVDCHSGPEAGADLDACRACHARLNQAFMAGHLASNGPDCLQCHDGADRMTDFDHNAVFTLDGFHAQLGCAACHAGFHFKDTPADCSGCHSEPEIHAGFFGLQCHACHITTAWTPARLSSHTFLLDHGGQGEPACQACHPDSYKAYTCTTCHEHQPAEITASHQQLGIQEPELSQCANCHPTGLSGEAGTLTPAGGTP